MIWSCEPTDLSWRLTVGRSIISFIFIMKWYCVHSLSEKSCLLVCICILERNSYMRTNGNDFWLGCRLNQKDFILEKKMFYGLRLTNHPIDREIMKKFLIITWNFSHFMEWKGKKKMLQEPREVGVLLDDLVEGGQDGCYRLVRGSVVLLGTASGQLLHQVPHRVLACKIKNKMKLISRQIRY